ncbi:binding-protein-dependent transport systems inner membrane component [Cellulomonas flavigena DSM 20109]|uniref:Binding-protein-dependent transport systems inner membrane component n=1 Tax=Cellulomonas flavigena (strain ATCC 482 / DSM 20109 / BCRC 11376 / JCM 18109 / NBRC 3775 / NCIMB 8073 / NRS 134) TaxID=446466 RepID=D5UCG6_CELFN|nr:ABC transporter permease [Cellulomonas flavigena]ADG74280.1 binding-protein-dependent transport systems inner membrane component [Cellulomonas flavigena DSM 20109]
MSHETGPAPVLTDTESRPLPHQNPHDSGPTRPASASFWSRRSTRVVGGAVLPLLLLTVWHLVTTSGLVPPYQLPAPASVWRAAVDLAERGDLQTHVAISVQRVLIGFAIGALAALAVAAFVGLSRAGDVLLAPTLAAIRAVPSLAWVPLLILWMKIGEESKITLVAIGAFFPVYTTVAAALRHVDPHLVEAGRAFGLRGVELFRSVQLPAVIPSVMSGLRLGLAQAWLFLVAAELIAASMGLGFLLTDSQNNGRVDRILLAIVLLALIGKLTDSVVALVEKQLLRRFA